MSDEKQPRTDALQALVGALLQTRFSKSEFRQDVTPTHISERAVRRDDDRSDVTNIVKAAADYQDGIDALIDSLKPSEEGTRNWQSVLAAVEAFKQANLPLRPEPALASPQPILVAQEPRFALVIGVSKYGADPDQQLTNEQFPHLKYAAADARELGAFLKAEAHYSVEALIDEKATQQGIMHALDELRKKCRYANAPNPTVLIYFAGHGARDDDDRFYLVPHDARRNDLFATALWSKTLDHALEEFRAHTNRLAIFLDACHPAIGPSDQRSAAVMGFDARGVVQDGRFVVASCMAGQTSYEDATLEHGIFTYHLLELLRCDDMRALPEEIELWSLFGALKSKVMKTAGERADNAVQTPFASFWNATDVVLAINEPLRRRKFKYLDAVRAAVLPGLSGEPARVWHADPEAVDGILTSYCFRRVRRPHLLRFYSLFDASVRRTDPADVGAVDDDCRDLLTRFDELEAQAMGRSNRVQGPKAELPSASEPKAADETADRRQAPEARPSSRVDRGPVAAESASASRFSVLSAEPPRQLEPDDVRYVLGDILGRNELGSDIATLFKMLRAPNGIVKTEVTSWLSLIKTTAPKTIAEPEWVRICEGINTRFEEKWETAQKVQGTTALGARAGQGA